jgi:alkylation response protein AidB-like acyl-CoA dehydrogenase
MLALTEEQQAVQTSIRRFARRELRWKARQLDNAPAGTVDWELLRKSCDVGLVSGQLPQEYGGTMERLSAVVALEELAHWEAGIATLLAYNSQAQMAVTLSSNKPLMERLCADILAGEAQRKPLFGALALTERHAGSDLLQPPLVNPAPMMVTAKRRGDTYVLSGRKAYCAGGNIATWLSVFATVDSSRSPQGLTGFFVPTDSRGFHVSAVLPTMGLRGCPLVEFYLEGVTVPREQWLTAEGEAPALVQQLSACSRCQGAAIAVGIARGAFDLAQLHSLRRVQGGGRIIQHQMVQHMLADMVIQIEAARLLTRQAAAVEPPQVALSSMAKVLASDAAVKVATDAVQIMGAYGTTLKSGAEKYFRDAKMTQIFVGTNELCRLAVTAPMLREAGLIPCQA